MPTLIEKNVADLVPGDVIGKPVFTEDGSVLIEADTVVMGRHIATLESNEIFSVILEVDEDDLLDDSPQVVATPQTPQATPVTAQDGDELLAIIIEEAESRMDPDTGKPPL